MESKSNGDVCNTLEALSKSQVVFPFLNRKEGSARKKFKFYRAFLSLSWGIIAINGVMISKIHLFDTLLPQKS